MTHFLQEIYGMTKVRRLHGGKMLVFFVDGDKGDLPAGFPTPTRLLKGFQFPEGVDPHTMTVVVDPSVSKEITMTEETRAENAAMKELLKGYKGKKRAVAFPSFQKPPFALKGPCPQVYRSIVMHHQGKEPVLFIGFDFLEDDLDANFWRKAMTLKNRIQLPKAPNATLMNLLSKASHASQ